MMMLSVYHVIHVPKLPQSNYGYILYTYFVKFVLFQMGSIKIKHQVKFLLKFVHI